MGRSVRLIPRTFHRIWLDEPERPEFLAWRESLTALHPGWELRTWSDSGELGWMRHHELMKELLKSDPFGRAPDLLRYELLWKFGGVYIDTDFEPLRSMDELLDDPRPFAAWENDRTMCTAVLAGPPKHPAIGILMDGVAARLKATEGKTANEAIGPEYATAHWREREDVRRLPPSSFYPVGWWEKHLLGKITYPSETFAVHHWAKGWGAKPKNVRKSNARVSFIVPLRDVDGTRERTWGRIKVELERSFPDAEVIVGTDDGIDPFHKTLALNRAAAEASGDVLCMWDADTFAPAKATREAIEAVAADPTVWVRPYHQKIKLNEDATETLLAGADLEEFRWQSHGRPEAVTAFKYAPPIVLHRQAWETVGGQDERFQGWHGEDLAFCIALERLVGKQHTIRGDALHLWHPRLGRSGQDLWQGQDPESVQAHRELVRGYRRARTPEDFAALREAVNA